MARQRRSGNSVQLFPFLAVLICAMGSLIFLLLVTTRMIRDKAVAAQETAIRAARAETPAPAPIIPPFSPPHPPFEEEPPPEETPVESLPDESPPRLAEVVSPRPLLGGLLIWAEPPQAPAIPKPVDPNVQLQATARQLAEEQARLAARVQAEETQRLQAEEQHRQSVQELQTVADRLKKSDEIVAAQSAAARALLDEKNRLDQELLEKRNQVKETTIAKSKASSQFALIPYDGTTGTTRRPILIECREHDIRFMGENVALTPRQLGGFLPTYNPLLAGTEALMFHWQQQDARNPGPHYPPYVLLIVRPQGTVSFYVARRLLEALRQPFGYELVEDNFELAVPVSDAAAATACQEAIQKLLQEKRQLAQSVIRPARPGSGDEPTFQHNGNGYLELRNNDEGPFSGKLPQSPWDSVDEEPLFDKNALARGNYKPGENLSRLFPESSSSSDSTAPALPEFKEHGAEQPGTPGDQRPTEFSSSRSLTQTPGSPTGSRVNPTSGERGPMPNGAPSAGSGSPGSNPSQGNPLGDQRLLPEETPGSNEFARAKPVDFALPEVPSTARRFPGQPELPDYYRKSNAPNGPGQPGQSPTTSPGSLPGEQGPSAGPGNGTQLAGPGQPATLPEFNNAAAQGTEPQRIWKLSHPPDSIGLERKLKIRVKSDRLIIGEDLIVPIKEGELRTDFVNRVGQAIQSETVAWGKPPQGFYWMPSVSFIVSPGGNLHHLRVYEALEQQWGISSTVQQSLEPIQ